MAKILKSKQIGSCLYLLMTGLFLGSITAQDSKISVQSSVDKSRITIGDLITYSVSVIHDPDVRVEMPGLGANLGGFQIRDYEVQDPKKEKGKIVNSVDYIISTFFTGEFEIPPVTVAYFLPNDTTGQILTTEKIKIVVESVKPSEAAELKDIKYPLEIPLNWWQWGKWALLGICVLAALSISYIVYRRKKAGKSLLPKREPSPRPPHEVALEGLDELKQSDLLEKREIKQYYTLLSDIIRKYFEGRYFISAMEMTTPQVLQNLTGAGIQENDYRLCQSFLEPCDLVKFAKMIPPDSKNQEILETAYRIVENTKVVLTPDSETGDGDLISDEEKSGNHVNDEIMTAEQDIPNKENGKNRTAVKSATEEEG